MSNIGSPITTSLIQTAQAQQTASKARARQRAEETRTARDDDEDTVELKVTNLESDDAVRAIPQNDSEEAEAEQRRKHNAGRIDHPDDADPPEHVDIRA